MKLHKIKKKDAGITLVALVVTIIILLILAGITISLTISDNGIITKAKQAKEKYDASKANEISQLSSLDSEMRGIITRGLSGDFILEDIEIESDVENLNTSAKVSAIDGNKVTINTDALKQSTITGNFEKYDKVMLYLSNTNNANNVGKYETYIVLDVNDNEITLDNSVNNSVFDNQNCQLIKIAEYKNFKVNSGVKIEASAYDGNSGGVIAIEADELIVDGKIDASNKGYNGVCIAPNNGTHQPDGQCSSYSGGSNKYKGGNGGANYSQGFVAQVPDAISITNNLVEKRMTFGGGVTGYPNTYGGGIVYLNVNKLKIGSQYPISANGQGSQGGVWSGGGAGGTVCINAKEITFTTLDRDYFAGANAGSGGTENWYNRSENAWPGTNGNDGTNIKGADAPGNVNGRSGGTGYLSNAGGGCQKGVDGENASATKGGNGANATSGTGWDAASGGGGGGFVSIYTNTSLTGISLTDATINSFYE